MKSKFDENLEDTSAIQYFQGIQCYLNGDKNAAIERFIGAASNGFLPARVWLHKLGWEGTDSLNLQAARDWLTDHGSGASWAEHDSAYCYQNRLGTLAGTDESQCFGVAVVSYFRAAKDGSLPALLSLLDCLDRLSAEEQVSVLNMAEGLNANDYPESSALIAAIQFYVAQCYRFGYILDLRYNNARLQAVLPAKDDLSGFQPLSGGQSKKNWPDLWRQAADAGCAEASYQYGLSAQDPNAQSAWLTHSAERTLFITKEKVGDAVAAKCGNTAVGKALGFLKYPSGIVPIQRFRDEYAYINRFYLDSLFREDFLAENPILEEKARLEAEVKTPFIGVVKFANALKQWPADTLNVNTKTKSMEQNLALMLCYRQGIGGFSKDLQQAGAFYTGVCAQVERRCEFHKLADIFLYDLLDYYAEQVKHIDLRHETSSDKELARLSQYLPELKDSLALLLEAKHKEDFASQRSDRETQLIAVIENMKTDPALQDNAVVLRGLGNLLVALTGIGLIGMGIHYAITGRFGLFRHELTDKIEDAVNQLQTDGFNTTSPTNTKPR